MRDLYLKIIAEIIVFLQHNEENEPAKMELAELLVHLLSRDEGPTIDQDIMDFLSEVYLFTTFGFNPERADVEDAIRDMDDLVHRFEVLKTM